MTYEYDRDANAIYFRLSDKAYAYGRDLDAERRIDYAKDGTPIGVEITCVRSGVTVDGLPEGEHIAAILREMRLPVYA